MINLKNKSKLDKSINNYNSLVGIPTINIELIRYTNYSKK